MGVRCESFISSICVLLKEYRYFFQEANDYIKMEDWAADNGFARREPTDFEIYLKS